MHQVIHKEVLLSPTFEATVLQSKRPISHIHRYLNGVHMYSGEVDRQIEAHHFCTHINEDFQQCLIYDSNETGHHFTDNVILVLTNPEDAKLIGIEYIVSDKLFSRLPGIVVNIELEMMQHQMMRRSFGTVTLVKSSLVFIACLEISLTSLKVF